MREALFIKQNHERWKQYEILQTNDPDKIAEHFIAITDDLAYAKTFYPKSKTINYLNKIATGFHQTIYKNKKEDVSHLFLFWKYELPLLIKKHHKEILYAFIFFIVFLFIGVISAKYDNRFVRLIMGDEYVNMTTKILQKEIPLVCTSAKVPL